MFLHAERNVGIESVIASNARGFDVASCLMPFNTRHINLKTFNFKTSVTFNSE